MPWQQQEANVPGPAGLAVTQRGHPEMASCNSSSLLPWRFLGEGHCIRAAVSQDVPKGSDITTMSLG